MKINFIHVGANLFARLLQRLDHINKITNEEKFIMLEAISIEAVHTSNIINKYKKENKDLNYMHRLFYRML